MLSMLRCCANRMTVSIQTKIVSRKYMAVSEKMEILLKQRDNIPRDYKLIYRDKNTTFAGFSYHSMNFMSWMTVGTLGYLWYNDIPIQEKAEHFSLYKSPFETAAIFTGIASIFLMSIWIRRRFVLRVYFSEKYQNYKAIFIGRVPFTYEIREFPAKSMTYVSKNSAFPWRQCVFNMGGHKMYLFEENFRTHSDFLEMLKPGEEEYAS